MARTIITTRDEGGLYFARYADFVDLQVSPAGYGPTPEAAVVALERAALEQPALDAEHAAWLECQARLVTTTVLGVRDVVD